MRINLVTPFADKDKAKALGARWDSVGKNWYIVDVADLTPFMRWIPDMNTATAHQPAAARPPATKPQTPALAKPKQSVINKSSDALPSCGCTVLPWEDCVHTTSKTST